MIAIMALKLNCFLTHNTPDLRTMKGPNPCSIQRYSLIFIKESLERFKSFPGRGAGRRSPQGGKRVSIDNHYNYGIGVNA